jgi:membrane fusion protein, multidrug efflux system
MAGTAELEPANRATGDNGPSPVADANPGPALRATGIAPGHARPSGWRRHRRALIVVASVVIAFAAYELVTSFVAYTPDAYVRSDLVAVAPEVTGPITRVHVRDNQAVHKGDPLVTIDPEPFALLVAGHRAGVNEARSQVQADEDSVAAAKDTLSAANAAAEYARTTQQRYAALSQGDDVSRQSFDRTNDELRHAVAAVAAAQSAVARAARMLAMHRAALAEAEANLGYAQWQLSQTQMTAPTDGTINNLTVRVGDTATANQPLIGIVDAHAWRIIANYKQSYLRGLRVGDTAWVWLDWRPWHLYRARIAGIGRGISRDPGPAGLLPYVAPTTDWILLQRRFPVTIMLVDPPPELTLFMGANARTIVFP